MSKKLKKKKLFFVCILGRSMTKIAGSRSASGFESGSGSFSTRHISADPDPDPDPLQKMSRIRNTAAARSSWPWRTSCPPCPRSIARSPSPFSTGPISTRTTCLRIVVRRRKRRSMPPICPVSPLCPMSSEGPALIGR
jgi:hypothetical protein